MNLGLTRFRLDNDGTMATSPAWARTHTGGVLLSGGCKGLTVGAWIIATAMSIGPVLIKHWASALGVFETTINFLSQ